VDIQLQYLSARLAERKITLTLTPAAKTLLAERGYDPLFGARPLKRAIQSLLENPLARVIISGKIKEGDHVVADAGGDSLVFRR
jgi:ATP-dependent Clp protease ATP-binding subunit ClpB